MGGAARVYNAGVDYIYTALGIFHPEHIGIVQLYGAAGEGASRETAAAMALEGVAAVQAALANFPQSQTQSAGSCAGSNGIWSS